MIIVATDTIADLPEELGKQRNIRIIPAWLHLKTGKMRTDSVNVAELFDLLGDEADIPQTDPLSKAEYCDIFSSWVGADDTLIIVSASGKVSKVFEYASNAAQQVAADRIFVHDSAGLSLWQGFQALHAAQMAAAGQPLDAILHALNDMRDQSCFFFVLDSLTYLLRGKRVNLAQYMLSVVFDVKPILAMQAGEVVPVGRARGRERASIEMQKRLLETMQHVPNVWMGIVHTKAPELAHRLNDQLQDTLRPAFSVVTDCGPTIAAHAGPGALGVAVCPARKF